MALVKNEVGASLGGGGGLAKIALTHLLTVVSFVGTQYEHQV